MDGDTLDEFQSYVSAQVDALRDSLDAWLVARRADSEVHVRCCSGGSGDRFDGAVSRQPLARISGSAACGLRRGVCDGQVGMADAAAEDPIEAPRRGARRLAAAPAHGAPPANAFMSEEVSGHSSAARTMSSLRNGRKSADFASTMKGFIGHRISEKRFSYQRNLTGNMSQGNLSRSGTGSAMPKRAVSGVSGINFNLMQMQNSHEGGTGSALANILAAAEAKRAFDSSVGSQPDNATFLSVLRQFFGEWFSAGIIILNAVSIGVSTEVGRNWPGWTVIDGVFAFLFLGEMLARMYSVGFRSYFIGVDRRCQIIKDSDLRWRLFEFLLVIMAFTELGLTLSSATLLDSAGANLNILRTLRLTRIARILRVCRLPLFTELVMMINGAIGGMRTLMWSLALVSLPLYAASLLMRESLADSADLGWGAETFRTLPLAWFTMFRCTVAGDCANAEGRPIALLVSERYGWAYGLVFCASTIIMSFGLFNVIAAIFVENTLAAAKSNTVLNKRHRLQDNQRFADKAAELVAFVWSVHLNKSEDPDFDVVGSRVSERFLPMDLRKMRLTPLDLDEASGLRITPEFFTFLRSFREFKAVLEELDIAEEDQVDLFDTLDVDGGGTIDLEEMVVGISKLRGEAKRSDIVGVGLVVRCIQADIREMKVVLDSLAPPLPAERCDSLRSGTETEPPQDDEVHTRAPSKAAAEFLDSLASFESHTV